MNDTLEGIISRITETDEWVSDLEDRIVEITGAEQNIENRTEKKKKKNEDSLRDLWDIKHTNIRIIGVPEGEERERERTRETI